MRAEFRTDLKAVDTRVGNLEQQVARLTGAVEVFAGLTNGRAAARETERVG